MYDFAQDIYVPDAQSPDTREAISMGIDALEDFANHRPWDPPIDALEDLQGATELFQVASLGLLDEGVL